MEISPSKLNIWINKKNSSLLRIIDCREEDEWNICHIKRAELIPSSVFIDSINKLRGSKSVTFVIYCHHGMRSLHATHHMRSKGFQKIYNLAGGIDRWASDIDPTMNRY